MRFNKNSVQQYKQLHFIKYLVTFPFKIWHSNRRNLSIGRKVREVIVIEDYKIWEIHVILILLCNVCS